MRGVFFDENFFAVLGEIVPMFLEAGHELVLTELKKAAAITRLKRFADVASAPHGQG